MLEGQYFISVSLQLMLSLTWPFSPQTLAVAPLGSLPLSSPLSSACSFSTFLVLLPTTPAKNWDYKLVFGNHKGLASDPVAWSVATIEHSQGRGVGCGVEDEHLCVTPILPQYLQVIVMGAEQNGLPKDYQEKLRAIKTNMYEGPLPMMSELERARRRAKERANHHSDP
ncbi:gamma-glutamylcyclotransferase-like isoform X2 [Lates japonicus]|uniref:Gamma-glutamylcyclotransferase-like isoform X2 n=1 Tax=Lates japonicus TaxID=270547 RepID=A0AAD3M765_LATJO|nr:gamma-glutamylcyclotransferase-like isoform X2 [Lates japonicus]